MTTGKASTKRFAVAAALLALALQGSACRNADEPRAVPPAGSAGADDRRRGKEEEPGHGRALRREWNPEERRAERERMVDAQIARRGVRDPLVLEAMRSVPRHLFVPEPYRDEAYADRPLPIGEGQTISQPYIVALMTELLQLEGGEKVLEVGTGSGYQAAVLGEIAGKVFTIEIVESLARRSAALLASLGYDDVTVRCGDGYAGWPKEAPFDAVIVTAAPRRVPKPLLEQLKPGGRLVLPLGGASQDLVRITRTEKGFRKETITAVRFVPMTGKVLEEG